MNDRNNNRGNGDKGKKRDQRSYYNRPVMGMSEQEKRKELKPFMDQKHLLAKLKAKYGENFPNIANVMNEFNSDVQIDILIRQIYTGKFNFNEYGKYLLHPVILGKIEERISRRAVNATIHVFSFDAINAMNPQMLFSWGITPKELFDSYNHDTAIKITLDIVLDSLRQTRIIKQQMDQAYMMQYGQLPDYNQVFGQIIAPIQTASYRITNERTQDNLRLKDHL